MNSRSEVRVHLTAATLDAAETQVQRVRELHFGEYVEDEDRNRCYECGDGWPCCTERALNPEVTL